MPLRLGKKPSVLGAPKPPQYIRGLEHCFLEVAFFQNLASITLLAVTNGVRRGFGSVFHIEVVRGASGNSAIVDNQRVWQFIDSLHFRYSAHPLKVLVCPWSFSLSTRVANMPL